MAKGQDLSEAETVKSFCASKAEKICRIPYKSLCKYVNLLLVKWKIIEIDQYLL